MKLHLLLEDEIEDKLEQLIKLQAYVGEYNVSCEVELIDDDLVALMHTGTRYVVDDEMLDALQSASSAYDYARNFIKGRFELGESAIAADAYYSYYYACDVIKGRFKLGEPVIAKDARYAYYYACDVIKGRFELGEPVIAKDAKWAYVYACDAIKGRFELGEPKILKSIYAENYKLLLRPKQ
jgi:hypothetical protein